MIVIINKGEVYNGVYFENEQVARNYLKWRHPKKKWVDIPPNIMRCKHTGMVMRLEELKPYKNIETALRDGHNEVIESIEPNKFNADNYDRILYQKDHQP